MLLAAVTDYGYLDGKWIVEGFALERSPFNDLLTV
jgi:hypothetical protein